MRKIMLTIIAMALLVLSGCADVILIQQRESTLPFGDSVHSYNKATKVNSEPADPVPVVGLDGEYAKSVMERYQDGPPEDSKDTPSIAMRILDN